MNKELNLNILKTLTYFDFFLYPLTKEEIQSFLCQKVDKISVENALFELLAHNHIYAFGEFYALQNNYALAERRTTGNARAQLLLKKASRISKFLSLFPFVTAIGISGSLSKNFADENADIDYFIITQSNKVWVARTIMHFFKKLTFLAGKQKFYCMNYYIDEQALQIEERDIYTATELATLVPMYGNGSISNLYQQNEWIAHFFPNIETPRSVENPKAPQLWIKKIIEKLFSGKAGDKLDSYLMRITTKRWKAKETRKKLDNKGEIMSLKGSKHISKPNPKHFHDHFLEKYYKRIEELEKKWKESIELAQVSSS